MNCDRVREVHIASAYFSEKGIAIVAQIKERYQLPKAKIEVILSDEFSASAPAEKLEALQALCQVRIVREPFLHAKACWLKGDTSKLVMGSSNFTRGGFEHNIELETVQTLRGQEEEAEVSAFFAYCRARSVPVSEDLIAYYKEIQPELLRLTKEQDAIRRCIRRYQTDSDPFSAETYDLTGAFFSFRDYEIFFPRNRAEKENPDIQSRRLELRDKMLELHNAVYPDIAKLGIACHRSKEHITSLPFPCEFNRQMVAWLGVRYGKQPQEVDLLNAGIDRGTDTEYGFQKHGCLQFCITADGFEIDLFHAVRNDAIDRSFLATGTTLKDRTARITTEIEKLKGQHMKWRIEDDRSGEPPRDFDIDTMPPEDFIPYYRRNDEPGYESYLYLKYEPDDPQIRTLESLKQLIVEKMTALLPLYNAMVYRIPPQ